MKRIAIVLVALALAGAACGADESTETTVAPSADTTAAPAEAGIRVALVLPGEINDLSWNQVMFEGAEALKTEGLISEVSYTELVPEETQSERSVAMPKTAMTSSSPTHSDTEKQPWRSPATFQTPHLHGQAASKVNLATWPTMHSLSTRPTTWLESWLVEQRRLVYSVEPVALTYRFVTR